MVLSAPVRFAFGDNDCPFRPLNLRNLPRVTGFSGAMPRYFFHLHNDLDAQDEEGRELSGLAAARSAAEEDARSMAAESVRIGHLTLSHFVEVAGEEGRPLFRVTFGEVVEIRR